MPPTIRGVRIRSCTVLTGAVRQVTTSELSGETLPIQLKRVSSNCTFGCLVKAVSKIPRCARPSTEPSCGSLR